MSGGYILKNVIVTGASGMIGATMIRQMLGDGLSVTGIIRPGSPKKHNLPEHKNLKIIECDINHLLSLKGKIGIGFDTFYHFAWDGTYGDRRDDAFLQEQNIKNTLEAVELARLTGCGVFVGAGSQAEFGHVSGKITDQKAKNPVTGYGIAKYTAGKLSKIHCERYGIRQSWGRIVSTYGPKDNTYTMIMSSIIGMVKGERLAFTKGDQVWDYVFSEDCANAFYLIGKSGKHGRAYTIGSGKTRRLKEFIQVMRDTVNPSLEIGLGERDYYPNQVMELFADISELTEDTGYLPQIEFEEGIKKTVDWYRSTLG